jgi:hypothetical protein
MEAAYSYKMQVMICQTLWPISQERVIFTVTTIRTSNLVFKMFPHQNSVSVPYSAHPQYFLSLLKPPIHHCSISTNGLHFLIIKNSTTHQIYAKHWTKWKHERSVETIEYIKEDCIIYCINLQGRKFRKTIEEVAKKLITDHT